MPPGKTELAAVKEPKSLVWNVRLPLAVSRESSSTSDGELTPVGTCGVQKVGGPLVRPTFERFGNTSYISTTTWPIVGVTPGVVVVTKPVNVAFVIEVGAGSGKSSADSISNGAPVSGRDALAISPSGLPVLNVNAVAAAGGAVN